MPVRITKDAEGKEHYILEEPTTKEPTKPLSDSYFRVHQGIWRNHFKSKAYLERCIWISYKIAISFKFEPTPTFIAKELGCSRQSVYKYLKILKDKGLI